MRYTECQTPPTLKDSETGHCSGSFFWGITTSMAVAKAGAPPHSTPYYHPVGWVHHPNCCSGGPAVSHNFVASKFPNKAWMSTQPWAIPMTVTALGGRSTQKGFITHKIIPLQVICPALSCTPTTMPLPQAQDWPLSHAPRWVQRLPTSSKRTETLPPHCPYGCPIGLIPAKEESVGSIYTVLHPELLALEHLKANVARGGWCLHTDHFTPPTSPKLDLCKMWGTTGDGKGGGCHGAECTNRFCNLFPAPPRALAAGAQGQPWHRAAATLGQAAVKQLRWKSELWEVLSGVFAHEPSDPGLESHISAEALALGPCLSWGAGMALPCLAEQFFQLPGRWKEEDGGQSNTIKVKAYSHSAHLSKY